LQTAGFVYFSILLYMINKRLQAKVMFLYKVLILS